ncbi:MAG TPA: AMP-binding protein, partial [Candidatus Atribacteria bacterium]|nr:AMP-binding protein [Candidatus Atribacteria bacterium]
MYRNILEYLEQTVRRVPDKAAYADERTSITFREVYDQSRAIGTYLYKQGIYKQPVVVFMKRQPKTIAAFFGVVYGGSFYVPIDEEMPHFRVELIFNNLDPRAVICDQDSLDSLAQYGYRGIVYLYDDIIKTEADDALLSDIRDRAIDTDPVYIVYTSGSTGIPKGIVGSHRAVIDYIESLSEVLEFSEDTIFGSQSPLYFDACLREIFGTAKFGAQTYLIPRSLFMFPLKLVEFLNEYKINTICWVVPALTMISSFKVLDKVVPQYLHTIAFVSEVFPIKQFNIWRKVLPNARFINL